MTDKFSADNIRAIFSKSFIPVGNQTMDKGGHQQPYFYVSDDAIIFPPVSDLETSSHFESISKTLETARLQLREGDFLTRKMIFPVAEQQRFFLGGPRNHWITLYYDPATQTATLLDSRPRSISGWYTTTPMKESLVAGLMLLNLPVSSFQVKCQGIQLDDICCGYWTTSNILALASGVTIDDQLTALSADDKSRVINDLNNILLPVKNNELSATTAVVIETETAWPIDETIDQTESISSLTTPRTTRALTPFEKNPFFANTGAVTEPEIAPLDEQGQIDGTIDQTESLSSLTTPRTTRALTPFEKNPLFANTGAATEPEIAPTDEQWSIDETIDQTESLSSLTTPRTTRSQSSSSYEENNSSFTSNSINSEDEKIDAYVPLPPVSAGFFMKIMCCDAMKTAGIVLLTVSFAAFFMAGIAFASVAAAASMTAIGLGTTTLMSIGATGAALGGSIFAAGYFMQKTRAEKKDGNLSLEDQDTMTPTF